MIQRNCYITVTHMGQAQEDWQFSLGAWVWVFMNDWWVCAKTSNCCFLLLMFKARDFTCRDETRDWLTPPVLGNMLRFVVWPIQRIAVRPQKRICYWLVFSTDWPQDGDVEQQEQGKNQVKLMIPFIENSINVDAWIVTDSRSMVGEKAGWGGEGWSWGRE